MVDIIILNTDSFGAIVLEYGLVISVFLDNETAKKLSEQSES
jgi:hypothetical protein